MNTKTTSRRAFLITSSSALALAGCGPKENGGGGEIEAEAPEVVLTEEELELVEMMMTEFELDPANSQFDIRIAPIEGGETKTQKFALARRQLARDPDKRWFYWPDDDFKTFDYFHIAAMGETIEDADGNEIDTGLTENEFEVTTDLLQSLVDANYFEHAITRALDDNDRADNRVIIALRGAEIVSDGQGDAPAITLKDKRPDHRNTNCVYVVWDRSENGAPLRVFEGSTVPSELYLALFQSFDGQMYRSSMMPQGFHLRVLGNMDVGKNVHPNTLRQQSICPVIREPDPERDFFDVNESAWDPNSTTGQTAYVGAHIHAAYWDARTEAGWGWKFSSAGCQTICGSVSNDRKGGAIVDFFEAMALPEVSKESDEYTSEKYATTYPMVLLSGREARLHAAGAPMSKMRRIRFGSSVDGEANPDHPIVQIQQALGVTADGQFGPGSMLKLIEVQRGGTWQIGSAPDGIVTPDLAASQDIELT